MASAELFQYFLELDNCFATAVQTTNGRNNLEFILRHLEEHVFIIATFLVLMNNVQQNVSGIRLCTLLEGIYQSLMEMSTELTLRAEAEAHVMGSLYHSTSQRGRPRYNIPATQLTDMRDLGFSWMAISQMLSVNVRTLYNHRIQLGLVDYGTFNNISNVDLDHLITEILTHTPGSGESYISGSLRGRGIRVQRWRVRERLRIVDPVGRALRRRRAIQRRVYNVTVPNQVWHIDTNHKLNPWGFVFHGGVDGYSRCITYMRCCTDNRASTAMQLFQSAVDLFGLPQRVRGDAGSENIDIARFMIEHRGPNRGSFMVGRSVHNQRIERLWGELNRVVSAYFKDLFLFMENVGILDSTDPFHIRALHHVYLPRINRSVDEFVNQWNHHSLRTMENNSLLQLWTVGMLQLPQHHRPLSQVHFRHRSYHHQQLTADLRQIDPLSDDGNHGIEVFLTACRMLQ
ncbi:uncharacterized protein LOC109196654 isoform X1 [Oreochromis niloticus]|uniref:uncharacterized protein LOC109196654 isoform X1 n=2 Tax=Oreochromis niloticus TaxID=8128 RepID=UPI000DF33BC2|nr:uncharacterized protein LOC109196654 isoform X1 [Oreochromis niloticus]